MLRFLKKVKVVEDPKYTNDYPNSFGNRLEINLFDGKKIIKEVLHPFGHPKNPMNDEDIFNKWRTLAETNLDKEKIEKQIEKVMKLEESNNLSDLVLEV